MGFSESEAAAIDRAKSHFCGLATDIDGTLLGGGYSWREIKASLLACVMKGKPALVVTGRGVSLEANLLPILGDLSITLATANGTRLVRYGGNSQPPDVIYSHELSVREVHDIIAHYKTFCDQYDHTPDSMLGPDAEQLIPLLPSDYSAQSFQHQGVWAEPNKVCLHMPSSRFGSLDVALGKLLGPTMRVYRGSETIVDVTRSQEVDGKKAAVLTFARMQRIDPDSIVCLGDSPHGNDSGLLSFPWSYTNNGSAVREYGLEMSHPDLHVIGSTYQQPVGAMHDLIARLLA